MSLCIWCNEKTVVGDGVGCSDCPTVPYPCSCSAGNLPHDTTCERSPGFVGKRTSDLVMKVARARALNDECKKTIGETAADDIVIDTVRESISDLLKNNLIAQFELLSCEQDPEDPQKIIVTFLQKW